MRFIKRIAFLGYVFGTIALRAQTPEPLKYFVYFCNKDKAVFEPTTYFDPKSIERRIRMGISLNDYSDLPVNDYYVKTIRPMADSLTVVSRWLNGVVIYASQEQIENVKHLSFVNEVELLKSSRGFLMSNAAPKELSLEAMALLKFQLERMKGNIFQKNNIDGTGMRIAVFDAGFPGVDDNPAFEHIRKNGRIKSTYDFVRRKTSVYAHNIHGTMVLSCIAGKYGDINIGLATGAEFLLARVENADFEPFSEEENWLAAAEWADKNGADIINSSLGYTFQRYFTSDMNGRTSLVAKAASIATRKGMLVVNAAGNEGTSSWKFIVTPADADSVLSVGGIDPYSDVHISFSSIGPTADKRLKPNVCALGEVMAIDSKGLSNVSGTSFASPLVAGFAACAWQTNRQLSNMQLYKEIEQSGHLYPYFDYAHGYGIPQADYFINKGKKTIEPTFDFVSTDTSLSVLINDRFLSFGPQQVEVQRNLYYTIQNSKGEIKNYYVLLTQQKEVLSLRKSDYDQDDSITVHYEGYTNSLQFK